MLAVVTQRSGPIAPVGERSDAAIKEVLEDRKFQWKMGWPVGRSSQNMLAVVTQRSVSSHRHLGPNC